jgi:N-acetylmuramoyl-L-alanine amidase
LSSADGLTSSSLLHRGVGGDGVADLKVRLVELGHLDPGALADDDFDHATETAVRLFQQVRGLSVDGVVGPLTRQALHEAGWRLGERVLEEVAGRPMRGDDVAALQHRLLQLGFAVGRVDGSFGRITAQALAEFQNNIGVPADGCAGPATFKALGRLSPMVANGRADVLRDNERILVAGPRLTGKVLVIDPAHGADDTGNTCNGLTEADLAFDLSGRVAERLAAHGAVAIQTRSRNDCPTDRQRADLANDHAADLVLSLHFDAIPSPRGNGVASYFFGSGTHSVGSSVGERLADLINREVCIRTGLRNGGSHGKTWDILRFTAMPAVHTELGYLSNADDASRLADTDVLDTMADALVVSIQRLFLPADLDFTTGRLELDGLLT